MQEQNSPVKKPRIRAQKKHTVLFIIACAILVIGLLAYVVGTVAVALGLLNELSGIDPSESELPGLAALVLMFSYLMVLAVPLVIWLICTVFWIAGMIPSGILTFRKKDKPLWMWVISLLLFCLYTFMAGSNVLFVLTSAVVSLILNLL